MDQRLRRQNALENQIGRLGRRTSRLQARSRLFSWYRLGILVLGGLVVWLAALRLGAGWGWRAALLLFLALIAAAILHRRLENGIEKLSAYQAIKSAHLARLHLAWDRIPQPASPIGMPGSPLAIDLDIAGPRSLHHLLDIAISREGSQLLVDWLTQSEPELEKIRARQPVVRELVPLVAFRDRLLLAFQQASREKLEGEKLLRWLEEPLPAGKLRWMLPVSAVWVAANLALFVLNTFAVLPAYWIISLSAYMAFYLFTTGDFHTFFEAIVILDAGLGKFRTVLQFLERRRLPGKPNLLGLLAPLRQAGQSPSKQLRRVKWVTAGAGMRMNPVIGLLLNLFLPWDFVFAYLAAITRSKVALSLPAWFGVLYNLEAFISLANFAYLNPDYTFPEIAPGAEPVLQAEGLCHPLLPPHEKVCNDIRVAALGEIAVITGSNMAGKSTFIRTIGINLCLAYAGGPVNAARFRARPFRLHTCIRISDSVVEGYSYFYAEVRCLKRLMHRLAAGGEPVLYLIDEIFRGTNNRERLVGSRAYLRSVIEKDGVGFLATHDLELAGLAEESRRVTNYHFRDEVHAGKLVFDYRLRPGPSTTTNALKIMRMEGLPVD